MGGRSERERDQVGDECAVDARRQQRAGRSPARSIGWCRQGQRRESRRAVSLARRAHESTSGPAVKRFDGRGRRLGRALQFASQWQTICGCDASPQSPQALKIDCQSRDLSFGFLTRPASRYPWPLRTSVARMFAGQAARCRPFGTRGKTEHQLGASVPACLERDETTDAHIAFLSMRPDPTPVTFRDVAAVLAMLTGVTAIALIVIGLIYLFRHGRVKTTDATAASETVSLLTS